MPSQLDEKPTHARHVGEERDSLAADLKAEYEKGASIRDLAEGLGISYGKVHRLLTESGVELRGRGGSARGGLTRGQAREYRQRLANAKVK